MLSLTHEVQSIPNKTNQSNYPRRSRQDTRKDSLKSSLWNNQQKPYKGTQQEEQGHLKIYMKTLYERIESVLLPYFEETMLVCNKCNHTHQDHTYGGKREVCQICACSAYGDEYLETRVVSKGETPKLVNEILDVLREYNSEVSVTYSK